MNWIDRLRGAHEPFPVSQAKSEGCPSTHNSIVSVNFNKISRFPDNDIASMCTVVCGSNGQEGTISHLTMSQNSMEFATALLKHWQEPVPLVMYGGDDTVPGSVEFFNATKSVLESMGFPINNVDVGGEALYRHGILKPDHVELRTNNYSETVKDEKTLNFW